MGEESADSPLNCSLPENLKQTLFEEINHSDLTLSQDVPNALAWIS